MLRWKMLLPVITAFVAMGLCTCGSAFFGADALPAPTRAATEPSATPTATATATSTPSRTSTTTPSDTPAPSPTPTATSTAAPSATPSATGTPTLAPPTATATPLPPPPNQPPIVTRFVSRFVPEQFTTFYEVFVTDPDGDKLTFKWSNTNPCGSFTWAPDTGRAQWFHPDPLCPHNQPVHPGTITVVIDDQRGGVVQCVYTGGSAIGALSKCP